MIKISNVKVYNLDGAFRGLRNPMDSWDLSDSEFLSVPCGDNDDFLIEKSKQFANKYIDYSEAKNLGEITNDEFVEKYRYIFDQIKNEVNMSNTASFIGPKDMNLAQRMIAGGADESKFMRQIMVSMDIEAPLYLWKELDTYKVGTVANSCSTMHKIASKPITLNCFSFDSDLEHSVSCLEANEYFLIKDGFEETVKLCEQLRQKFNAYMELVKKEPQPTIKNIYRNKALAIWRALIQILPCAWNQKRTITLNYQVLRAMYMRRRTHKLIEWRDFCDFIENELPYAKDLICYERRKNNENA